MGIGVVRVLLHPDQLLERQHSLTLEDPTVDGYAHIDGLAPNPCTFPELRQAFVHPNRDFLLVQACEEMKVFVVDQPVAFVSSSIQPKHDEVLVEASLEDSTRTLAFPFPVLGKEFFQTVLVLGGKDNDGGAIVPGFGKRSQEDGSNPLEVTRGAAGLFLAGVTNDDEVWAFHLDPGVLFLVRPICGLGAGQFQRYGREE